MSSITGTGVRESARTRLQHGSSILRGRVPDNLLGDCDKKREDAMFKSGRKSTNLYRRVSTVTYHGQGGLAGDRKNQNGSKCMVCRVTLVKSSRLVIRAGMKLRCPCNVRVCSMCLDNTSWFHTHMDTCETVRRFVCSMCMVFHETAELACCQWLCPGCYLKGKEVSTVDTKCPKCRGELYQEERHDIVSLWARSRAGACVEDVPKKVCDVDTVDSYKRELGALVIAKVASSRHISPRDIRALFYGPSELGDCTCHGSALCTRCTPVLTIMALLAENPKPLMSAMSERAIPGRDLARNLYSRSLLLGMLNNKRVPLCANGDNCKGMLSCRTGPLRSLMSPEMYRAIVSDATLEVERSTCIVCLFFNQSAAVARMLAPDSMYRETPPSGPVYYFNIKLNVDVGMPVSNIGAMHYIVQFQGMVGCFKPMYYYNYVDMLAMLALDKMGNIVLIPNVFSGHSDMV